MINRSQVEQNNLKILDSSQVLQNDKDQNIAKLKELLPNVINSDNQLNTQALQDVLDIANTTSNNQGYELTFAGKGIAKAKADEPTTKELEVELEQSKDFDNTENVVIRGDNIDTLKILRANYTNKIKMIYIDPPYNTKNENFVYNDNFKKNEEELIKEFGLAEETQNFLTNVYGTRSHSGWLSFMYPRLKIARELLKEDGVIFISIDDNEQANLKIICDEIFGEENFVADIIWEKKFSPQNDAKRFSDNHDYILCYTKDKNNWLPNLLERTSIQNDRYKNLDNDPRGVWTSGDLLRKDVQKSGLYTIITPNGTSYAPPSGRSWRVPKNRLKEMIKDNRIWFGENGGNVPRIKRFLSDIQEGIRPLTIWKHTEAGHNQEASQELRKLFDGESYFDTPKPCRLIKRILKISTEKDSAILDFFAGSGTTGDAVMQLNAEDGGKRKYILAQLDEAIDEKKEAYKFCKDNNFEPVISSITIERLNRAGEKIKADVIAELEAEQSKKKPNQEKLAELREKYVRVFGNSPKDNRNPHENGDLLTSIEEIPNQVGYCDDSLTVESIENNNSPSVKGWQSQTDGVVLEKNHPTDKVGTPPAEGNGLDIGYKVFSLKDKPRIAEVTNDGGQVSFVPQNLREKTLDTLANMLCATCKPLHTKIETLITDRLYKADNEIYLLGSVDKSQLEIFKDLKINVDGYSDLDLEDFLNLGVTDKDNVSVVY
ncbi:site-specific DNA-methyltransferase [Francisella philomiragia]|uniref:site-specific DNA-methyltransferase n=1 Tax=Francisella philomiragia TaxID=28110 RepID=UPI001C9E13E3|nr:site-specific DNA-methyltransferase [Francisella philomiragia]MBY7735000.1 site-specific DNA-methyltransferase [Francisella philomiragia]